MALKDCTGFVGRRLLIQDLPSQRDVRNAVFVPPGTAPQWGLFEPSGRSVPEAMLYTGAGSLHTPLCSRDYPDLPDCPVLSDKFDYFFLGNINPSYLYFFANVLSRLWSLPPYARSRLKLVFSSPQPLAQLMAQTYFRTIVTALDLTEDHFMQVLSPARFPRITVAAAAFEELSLVHDVFADLAHSIGRKILPEGAQDHPGRVLFFSQEKLSQGNVRVENESALTAALRAKGIGTVYPSQMTFRDQLKLWASNPLVIGYNDACLHTSIFFPQRRVVTLAHSPDMWANQCLVDKANNNHARYLYDSSGLEPVGAGGGFQMNYRIPDPEKFADELADFTLG
ncbi:glycosyltransferase family 61 protein [Gluconobacter cerinus]|uniref:glycosyltransferase family 61 protein n=1 Tax=Gluconobacter cerinus TaxID=38307 RepID=UPI001B8BAE4B|nr:glycosyltransferase family 61 protein [Gluconobacter cerinus]MBS1071091.1 glycosyltransferase family 61 protein [Gluconobacter cerinus]